VDKTRNLKQAPQWFPEGARFRGLFQLEAWPFWVALMLWLAVSFLTTLSYQSVHWTAPQPAYVLVLIFSIVLALVNARLNKPFWMTVVIFLAAGVIITVWQSVILFKAPNEYGTFQSIDYAFTQWGKTLTQSSPNENNLYFSLFLIIITWFWGYIGTWRLVKSNSVWLTLLFGLIIILVNLAFLNKAYFGYFYAYIFLSILLISYIHFLNQNYHNGNFPRLPGRIPLWISGLILFFGGVLILVISLAPEMKSDQLRTLYELKVRQSSAVENFKINIFSSVSSKGTVVKSNEQDVMRFNSRPNLSEDIQFKISSTGVPNYWRVRRYDTYNSFGWSTSPFVNTIMGSGESQAPNITPAEHYNISYTVINKIKTDIVLSSGKYLFTNTQVITHYYETQNNNITANPDDNLVSVSTPHIYQVDDSYTVNSQIIKPTIDQLNSAGLTFPPWIQNQYLQLPADLPASVTRLSRNLIRPNMTEYSKVMAVANYLAKVPYVFEGSYPPDGKDAVEDFLLVQKTGNCTNFATAAVVLLRSAGVPARLCTGYIPHYVDKSANTFIVLAKDYHAWLEIYFPGYGWIEFEVTPGLATTDIAENTSGNTLPGLSAANIDDFPPYFPANPNPSSGTPSIKPPVNSESSSQLSTGQKALIAFLVFAALIAVYIAWRRRMSRRDDISGIMARIQLVSPLVGVPFRSSQTTEEYAESLSRRLPKHRLEIEKLTQIYLISRYSRSKLVILQDEHLLSRYWGSIFWGVIRRFLLRS
jgi:transglutaminase-like putative cysteine protease